MGYKEEPYYTISTHHGAKFSPSQSISLMYNAPQTATMTVLKQE